MAYGTDTVKPEHEEPAAPPTPPELEPEPELRPAAGTAAVEPSPRSARTVARERRPWEA
jgi:hypothetical protein